MTDDREYKAYSKLDLIADYEEGDETKLNSVIAMVDDLAAEMESQRSHNGLVTGKMVSQILAIQSTLYRP